MLFKVFIQLQDEIFPSHQGHRNCSKYFP